MPDITEALGPELGGLEAAGEQGAHHLVGEELHPAVGVVDDEPFTGAEQLVGDDERADGVVARPTTRIANHVRVAFGQAGILRRIQSGIHTGENGESPSCGSPTAPWPRRRPRNRVGTKDSVSDCHVCSLSSRRASADTVPFASTLWSLGHRGALRWPCSPTGDSDRPKASKRSSDAAGPTDMPWWRHDTGHEPMGPARRRSGARLATAPVPLRLAMEGRYCRLEPLDAARHGDDLYRANSADDGRMWTYLPYGPAESQPAYEEWLTGFCVDHEVIPFAVVDPKGVAHRASPPTSGSRSTTARSRSDTLPSARGHRRSARRYRSDGAHDAHLRPVGLLASRMEMRRPQRALTSGRRPTRVRL